MVPFGVAVLIQIEIVSLEGSVMAFPSKQYFDTPYDVIF